MWEPQHLTTLWAFTTCYRDSFTFFITHYYISQITVGHTRSSESVTVFASRCLVAASNSGPSLSFGVPKYPRPQLSASHSNCSQWMNPSRYLTNSVRVSVNLWLAVYRQSVHLGAKPLETHDHFFQLNICGHSPYVTSSLTRGWVCRLQLLLVLASAVTLRFQSRRTHDHILLSQIRDSPNLEGQVPVFLSPRNRVARLYPQALGSLSVPFTTRRAKVEVFDPVPHGFNWLQLTGPVYNISARTAYKTPLPLLLYTGRCLVTAVV
jgi:hypothetical protein